MITMYALILSIGYLLGEFYFWNGKFSGKMEGRYMGVLIHFAVYYAACLLSILPIFSKDMIFVATCAAIMYFVIDSIKYVLLRKKNRKNFKVFVIDQCAHIMAILIMAYIFSLGSFSIELVKMVESILNELGHDVETIFRWVLAILFIHIPANVFIQNFLGRYKSEDEEFLIKPDNRAGRRIGTVERLVMLFLLSKDQFAALGFVLTAKSIARYDKITKDEKFAEYYLMGTLMSALCVIVCKILVLP